MARWILISLGGLVAVFLLAVLGLQCAVDRMTEARLGPVHRFAAQEGESFLTDERAVIIAREVMRRDGFAESVWILLEVRQPVPTTRSVARHLVRNANDRMAGTVGFQWHESRAPQRFIHIELRDGEITARGEIGK